MKILLSACIFGTALGVLALNPIKTLVGKLNRADDCMAMLTQRASSSGILIPSQTITPTFAAQRIQENCSATDIEIMNQYMGCLSDAMCEWTKQFAEVLDSIREPDPLTLLNRAPSMRECPKPEQKPSPLCGTVFKH